MAKKRRHRRRRSSNPSRRRHRRRYASRRGPIVVYAGARRRNRHHRRRNPHRRHDRRRNPTAQEFFRANFWEAVGGAAVGFFGTQFLPENIPILAQYNAGWTGYALDLGVGLGLSWLVAKFWSKPAGNYAMIGTGLAVLARIVTEQLGTGTPAGQAAASMSGNLDYNLSYYTSDAFPFPQGPGGPYGPFPGTPALPGASMVTSAAAVRAGRAAAAGVPQLTAGGGGGGIPGGSQTVPGGSRWGGQWD